MYLLGTLHTSGDAAEMIFKRPNPAKPSLRGTDTLPPKANGVPRFKFLPVQIVDRPAQFAKNPTPASNKVLALQLTNVSAHLAALCNLATCMKICELALTKGRMDSRDGVASYREPFAKAQTSSAPLAFSSSVRLISPCWPRTALFT